MAKTAQKGEVIKQINNLKITRINLNKNTKAGEPYLYKVFDPNGNQLYASIYLKDIEEKCKAYNAYTVKGQRQEQTKNDKTAFHKEKKPLNADQLKVIKLAYDTVKQGNGKIKIGDKLKEKYGITHTDEEVLNIWANIITSKATTDRQMKYGSLAHAFNQLQQRRNLTAEQKEELEKQKQEEIKQQRVTYIVNKLFAVEGMLTGLMQIKELTNTFVNNEKIMKYIRSLDADNADVSLQERIKKEGILGIAKALSEVIDRATARAKKYNLSYAKVNSTKYSYILEMIQYEDALFNKVVELHKLTKELIRENKYETKYNIPPVVRTDKPKCSKASEVFGTYKDWWNFEYSIEIEAAIHEAEDCSFDEDDVGAIFIDRINKEFLDINQYFPDVKVKIYDYVDSTITIDFEGKVKCAYTPGEPADWDYPGDDGEGDVAFTNEDLNDYAIACIERSGLKVLNLEAVEGGVPEANEIEIGDSGYRPQADYR